jgi:L-glyceraldehyde 3-phosphate reductase
MYAASPARYSTLPYHRCGKSGLMLPAVSLGLWHNFGDTANFENMRLLCRTAFDNGITHFDLANNYGAGQRREELRPHPQGRSCPLPR